VSEAMSDLGGEKNATNDHARRDFVTEIGMMSMNPLGETGFRFVRIDLLDRGTLILKSVLAQLVYKDVPYRGSFSCSDDLLNKIWMTGAYTQHLNMQEFVWDGIKRDRLVWIADMHPEIMTIRTVFGEDDSVKKSLDFIREETPLPGWMNDIATYTMWYVIILYDWFFYTGDWKWLYEQREYLKGVAGQLQGLLDEKGSYKLEQQQCFVDWPSCNYPQVVDAGTKGIHYMAMDRLVKIFMLLQDKKSSPEEQAEYGKLCSSLREEMKLIQSLPRDYQGSKAAAALCVLGGLEDVKKVNEEILSVGGSRGMSTYLGGYILAARAQAGDLAGALACIREYWGGMLALGATTFWEDFNMDWMKNAAPIDRLPKAGEVDVHGSYGSYCYVGYRHSLCHGWASGPTSWLTEHILGIRIVEEGCRTLQIKPDLGDLEWAEGVYPTPLGDVKVKVWKDGSGETLWKVDAPEEIKIV